MRDNLIMSVPPWRKDKSLDIALDAFPILKQRASQTAGSMSGGEQQMLAVAWRLSRRPKIVLFDEVSIGLAPLVIDRIYESMTTLSERGMPSSSSNSTSTGPSSSPITCTSSTTVPSDSVVRPTNSTTTHSPPNTSEAASDPPQRFLSIG